MKRYIQLILLMILPICYSIAQSVPQGMKYQAVARDLQGHILANKDLQLKIILYSDPVQRVVAYEEMHKVLTSDLGLFSLSVGDGIPMKGHFNSVPWSEQEVWMSVAIQTEDETDFTTISDSKMLSVPYAFHAATAGEIAGGSAQRGSPGDPYNKIWSLLSNYSTVPGRDVLGTGDMADLVIVTNSKERIRVLDDGDVIIGQSTEIGTDLKVKKNVYLNSDLPGNPITAGFVQGETINYGDLTVENMSSTHLTGTLDVDKRLNVDGATDLNDSLTVNNGAPTLLTGTLKVLGPSDLASLSTGVLDLFDSLTVHNMAPTHLSGTLTVDKATQLNNSLSLSHEATGFVASFENTNNGNGDGIQIKLGKTHPRWNNNGEVSAELPEFTFLEDVVLSTKNLIEALIDGTEDAFSGEDFADIALELTDALEDELGAGLETFASFGCNLTKDLVTEINTALSLPYDGFSEISIPGLPVVPYIDFLDIGPYGTPATTFSTGFPEIPGIPVPSCPAPPELSLWELPNFQLVSVPNSLTNENQFIQFLDKDDRQLGSIRALSIEEWGYSYLNLTYFLNVFNSFAGVTVIGLDPTQIAETLGKYAINGLAIISNLTTAYNSIGVEYSSGFGDYAEWLPRVNVSERITPGDIVAVRAGQITRNLTNAEQVMAVSSNPIVLGNTPPVGEDHLGQKVAFMGQIPVKVMGSVSSGDYIVAKGTIPGYGVAISPANMTAEDFAMSVGRSWQELPGDGPKMVNTVVGIHNGDYLHILKDFQKKIITTDARMTALENRFELLFSTSTQTE